MNIPEINVPEIVIILQFSLPNTSALFINPRIGQRAKAAYDPNTI